MARRLLLCVVTCALLLVPNLGFGADDPLQPKTPDDYELHKLLIDTINQVEQNYVKPVERRKLVEAAIRGVLSELDDYSGYVGPDRMTRFQTAVSHQFDGIGVNVSLDRGRLTVISPYVGSPAYRAGLTAGDQILEIDGKSTEGLGLDDAVSLLKGEIGTSVSLKVSHPGRSDTEEISVTRAVVYLETVLGDLRGENDQWDYLLDHNLRIGYVRLTGFGTHTARDLRKVVRDLEKAKVAGLILDLRFNPGGLLSCAIQVADLFVSEGKIVSTAGRNVKEKVWEASKRGTFGGVPMVVLINGHSASASEIVAACLQDHDRAVIVGQRSYGKGSVQRVIEMEGGHSALKLTTAGYLRPNGKNIDRHPGDKDEDEWGVKPNEGYELKLSPRETYALDTYRRERDNQRETPKAESESGDADSEPDSEGDAEETKFVDRQLEMALEYLRGKLAKPVVDDSKTKSEDARELAKAASEAVETAAEPVEVKPEAEAAPKAD